jgi:hypothetical protein
VKPGVVLPLLLLCALSPPACVSAPPAPAAHQHPQHAAVLAAVERFFAAMAARDSAALAALLVPEAMTFSQRIEAGVAGPVRVRSNADLSALLLASEERLEERLWDPVVLVHPPLAHVWTPYEFRIDGELSHCGIDSFQLLLVDGAWKLTNMSWTVEPDACAALGAPAR